MVEKAFAASGTVSIRPKRAVWGRTHVDFHYFSTSSSSIRASLQSMDGKNNVFKEMGLFSLQKKIEDAVLRAEVMASTALEVEEARKIEQEEMIRKYNIWDDLSKSNECLIALSDTTKAVDALKDLKYKAEEAKLITELVEMDAINYWFFNQAYSTSLDVSKSLDHYEMSKVLTGPYDMEGACIIIRAGSKGTISEGWAEKILGMYIKWAEKRGCKGRIIEQYHSKDSGVRSATVEFESKYAFGYLSGESGRHLMIKSSLDGSLFHETILAGVDVIPLFLETAPELQMDDDDLEISSISHYGEEKLGNITEYAVSICHVPTGINVQCSGERNHFSNKMKALNRLKAKLLVIAAEQAVYSIDDIKREAIVDMWQEEVRRYVLHPLKLVQDVKTGIQLHDLTSVLDGNLEPLIGAHISNRQAKYRRKS